MKPIKFSKVLAQSMTLRSFRLALVAPAMVLTMNMAQAAAPAATTPAAPAAGPTNWIDFTIGGASIHGDEAAFMRRTQTTDFYGGISDMFYSHALNDSTTLTLDGHALPGNEDYELNMNLEKTDLGYVKAGFKQFRTWYDASGGALQGARREAVDMQFGGDEQSLDRGEIYFEAGLRQEKMPEITFSYRHLYRNGQKDSTSWGDTQSNLNWGGIAGSNVAFKLMPSLLDIDEKTDIFELEIEHTIGNTDLGGSLVYESVSVDNTRTTPRWSTNKPAAITYVGVNEIKLNEQNESDMFASNVHSVTRFSDKAWLSFGASYSQMDTDIDGGSRSYNYGQSGLYPNMTPATTPQRDYSYDQMSGGSSVGQFITNLNFMWTPVQDLTVTPSLRYENESVDTISKFRAYNSTSWVGKESLANYSDVNALTEALDIRYKGIDNVVLYAKGQFGQEDEAVNRIDRYLPGEFLYSDSDVNEQEYTMGANWYALSNLSLSLQGLHAERDQTFDHNEGHQAAVAAADPGGANSFRPIMTEHDTTTDDLNVRLTYRPLGNVSLVTRYDYVHTEIENRGINWSKPAAAILYPTIESGDIVSHIVSESVTWNPTAALYVQGTVSWISSETTTPESYTGQSDNDYLAGSLSVGYAIDERTELTATYSYYETNNYSNSHGYTGVATMGYGLNTEESAVGLTLTRAINANMTWNLHYGFITSDTTEPDQSGGQNDFDAHLISTGLQVRF